MNDWQKDWWQQLEKTTATLEDFFNNFNQSIESFAEDVANTLEEFGEQLQDAVFTEVDRHVDDFVDFVAEANLELEFTLWDDLESFAEDFDFVDITTEIPSESKHAACIGCRNYHGQAYNGQILVCGMHPYGVDDSFCPDWEQ